MELAEGELSIVSTPIGNLKDITLRALDVLKASDLILSEDTRETDKLLNHYGIKSKQISYRDQNHEKVFLGILNDLLSGKKVALVSDSGTPVISDPGFRLIRDLRKNGFNKISTVPGPSAVIAALSASGFPTDKFCFLGFLPKKANERRRELEKTKDFEGTLVIYESPQRLQELLILANEIFANRFACVCAELTKVNERYVQGSLVDLIEKFSDQEVKGEIVLLIAKDNFNYD
jgi:16S rRNA (cytidine1402-2'-O)-methyltransferase